MCPPTGRQEGQRQEGQGDQSKHPRGHSGQWSVSRRRFHLSRSPTCSVPAPALPTPHLLLHPRICSVPAPAPSGHLLFSPCVYSSVPAPALLSPHLLCSRKHRQPQSRLLVLQTTHTYQHLSLWCVFPPRFPCFCLWSFSRRPPFCLFSMEFSSDETSPFLRFGVRGKNVFILSFPFPCCQGLRQLLSFGTQEVPFHRLLGSLLLCRSRSIPCAPLRWCLFS